MSIIDLFELIHYHSIIYQENRYAKCVGLAIYRYILLTSVHIYNVICYEVKNNLIPKPISVPLV